MQLGLSNGGVVEIDDADYLLVKDLHWYRLTAHGCLYAAANLTVGGKSRVVLMHRLLLGLTDRTRLVDHVDGNGLDNRRTNIRECSHAENMRNTKVRSHSGTGIRNVRFDKRRNLFHVVVTMNGIKHRKWFSDAAKASEWACLKRNELHGRFAYQQGGA
jgi:hypothetical protein